MPGRPIAALIVAALVATSAGAQTAPGGYARVVGDTLHYHRVMTVSMITDVPRGQANIFIAADESIGLTFVGKDSAVLWLDALDVSESTPLGRAHPSVDAVLRRPFVLKFDARGRTKVLSAPPVPDSITDIFDLSLDFATLMPEVPVTPLAVGAEWTDSAVHRSAQHASRVTTRVIVHNKADRDTTVGGVAALVVNATETDSTLVVSPAHDGRPTAHERLHGTATNSFLFAPSNGQLVWGGGSDDYTGVIELYTGAGLKRFPQTVHAQWTMTRIGSP